MKNEKIKKLRWDAIIERFKHVDGNIYGAEVGVWRGKMSEQLLSRMPNLYLSMVDRWGPPEVGDSYYISGSEMALCDQKKFNTVFAEALQRINPYKDRVVNFKMETCEAAKYFFDHSLDFCFIDADHSYEGVKNDIKHWKDKVKEGGYLCGHDWGNLKKGNVQKAVEEFFDQKDIILDCNSTWFVRM